MIRKEKESLGQGRRALGEGCWIERRCGYNEPFAVARNGAFEDAKAKRRNERGVSVLCDGQDDAIVLLRRSLVVIAVVIIVAMTFAVGVLVGQGMSGMILSGCGKLLEEMMHPVRCGRSEKKPECGGGAEI